MEIFPLEVRKNPHPIIREIPGLSLGKFPRSTPLEKKLYGIYFDLHERIEEGLAIKLGCEYTCSILSLDVIWKI